MAKIAFTKLGLTKAAESAVKFTEINGQTIEVKQYLPINDKLNLIANVLNQSADENNFANPIKLDVFTSLEIVFAYTNISFTEKQKEDLVKLYDLLESNGIFNMIIAEIPKAEYAAIVDGVTECANAVYTYRNSVMGILDTIAKDYDTLDFDINSLRDKLSSAENLTLLKDIMTKLG